jgi:choice-of-anchor A domain-containing protein
MSPRTLAFAPGLGWPLVLCFFGLAGSVLLAEANSAVPPARSLNLLDLQVFASRSIQAAHSDFQGPTAAGGDVDLSDFEIKGDLTAGGRVTFRRGAVEAGRADLVQVSTRGQASSSSVQLALLSHKLDRLGARLANRRVTAQAAITETQDGGRILRTIDVGAGGSLDVVELKADQIASAWPVQTRIRIHGDGTSRLVVRVLGPDIRWRGVDFSMTGGIDPADVVFFFPQAYALDIADSGGALDGAGRSFGIPGSIVAPDASLRFGSALVTGQVFARDILPVSGSPSGQINALVPPSGNWSRLAGGAIYPNQVLRQIDLDLSFGCETDETQSQ